MSLIGKVTEWIRDKWRGYTDADVDSLIGKIFDPQSARAGAVIPLTSGEFKAYRAHSYCELEAVRRNKDRIEALEQLSLSTNEKN